MPDTLAEPYARMVAQQRAYNARQAAELAQSRATERRPVAPLADRMYRPAADDMAELRRQQAAFQKTERAISRDNAWMAIPALAPAAVVAAIEAPAFVAARLAAPTVKRVPLRLVEREPYLRVGDNYATRAGRRAHDALGQRIAQKPNWGYNQGVPTKDGRTVRPDVRTPLRVRKPGADPDRFQMELKPNTSSGRAAAARALRKYEATGKKTRAIFYDPKDFI